MKNKFISLKYILFAAAIVFCQQLFASGYNLQEEIDPELQRVISVIDYPYSYNLDPHTACYSSDAQVLTGLFEGLFSYDPVTLEPVPALCESYKVSRNRKKWTFTLREGYFSNGEKITAQTFYDSWISLLSNPSASFASMLDCINGAEEFRRGLTGKENVRIEVRDEKTLLIRLRESAEHLPKILCHHAFSAVTDDRNVFSGAFIVKSCDEKSLVLEKNEFYRDKENVHVPGFIFYRSTDAEENTYLFNTGAADWITNGFDSGKIINASSLHIYAEFGTHYFFFSNKNKPWDDPEIRMALLEAVPWSKLRADYLVPATTFIYPLYGYPKVTGLEETDEEEAADLMKSARKRLNLGDEELKLVFAVNDELYMQKQAELLAKAWEQLGVKVEIQTCPVRNYITSIPGWNADVFHYAWIGDFADPLAFLELFRGNSSLNPSEYNNPEYDKLLLEAANASGSELHYKYLSEAEQLLLDDAEIIPVSHPVSFHAINLKQIGGWSTNALDLHPLKYLYIKKTKVEIPNLVKYEASTPVPHLPAQVPVHSVEE